MSHNGRTILLLDGLFLSLIGFGQTINSFIGYKFALGGYKILNELTFASLGIFEMNFMIGLIGVILVYASRTEKKKTFWLTISILVHSFIVLSNIIFWSDVFVVNGAQFTGKIVTLLHIFLALISFYNVKLQRNH